MSESKSGNGKSDIITLKGVGKSFWRGKERLDVLKELEDQDIDPWLRGLIEDKL